MFKSMFPDSYVINHGLATHFKQILKDGITKSDCYVVSFHESLNDITETFQIVRYWTDVSYMSDVRYWTSSFLGHSTHSDLLKHFNESLSGLHLSRMLQVSMDGPAVNWKFFDALMNYRSECELPQLINIDSCSLHIVHGVLKTAVESTSWKIKQTLKGIWQILHESPARREDFESITETNKFPLFFCTTKWIGRLCY